MLYSSAPVFDSKGGGEHTVANFVGFVDHLRLVNFIINICDADANKLSPPPQFSEEYFSTQEKFKNTKLRELMVGGSSEGQKENSAPLPVCFSFFLFGLLYFN